MPQMFNYYVALKAQILTAAREKSHNISYLAQIASPGNKDVSSYKNNSGIGYFPDILGGRGF